MTRHPKVIPYSEWVELKMYIHQLFTTGYDADEQYRKLVLNVMRDIEKVQVEKEKGVEQNV